MLGKVAAEQFAYVAVIIDDEAWGDEGAGGRIELVEGGTEGADGGTEVIWRPAKAGGRTEPAAWPPEPS